MRGEGPTSYLEWTNNFWGWGTFAAPTEKLFSEYNSEQCHGKGLLERLKMSLSTKMQIFKCRGAQLGHLNSIPGFRREKKAGLDHLCRTSDCTWTLTPYFKNICPWHFQTHGSHQMYAAPSPEGPEIKTPAFSPCDLALIADRKITDMTDIFLEMWACGINECHAGKQGSVWK